LEITEAGASSCLGGRTKITTKESHTEKDMEVQLISAIRQGDVEVLKELLNDPVNEGYTFTFMGGATPLHWYLPLN
jgi:hypothetical protein